MEYFMNLLIPFLEITLWVIVVYNIVKYEPKKEEMFLMKDERGEDIVIYTVKLGFDRHHNYIHHLEFRCGDTDEESAKKGSLRECENIVQKLNICGVMRITLIDEDVLDKEVLYRIRRNSETGELVEPEEWRIESARI